MRHLVWIILQDINLLILLYFLSINSFYLITSLIAFRFLKKYAKRMKLFDANEVVAITGSPPITLFAPAYNEEATCVHSIRSLLTLQYADYEIIVINDGSKDATMQTLIDAFELKAAHRYPIENVPTKTVKQIYWSAIHPNLWVIDKVNGGKADALNCGLNYCSTPYFCAMDADSLLEPDALSRIIRPFLEDERTIAAGGIIRIVNGCEVNGGMVTKIGLPEKLLPRLQVLEYLRAFLAGRMGWDALQATLIISGAFGIFRRSIVAEVGGYSIGTVGEDMELVVRLHRHCLENKIPYRISFVPDPVAWTECPEQRKILGRQRERWQRGLVQVLTRHRKMLMNPRYGRIGLLAYPFFFFLEMLGPIVEFSGYILFIVALIFGSVTISYAVAFLMIAILLGVALSIAAVGLEELSFHRYPTTRDVLHLFWLAVIESFGYRQMLTYYRLKGIIFAMRGVKSWGVMERQGFTQQVSK